MKLADVRTLALALPGTEEHEHWGRPSFRAGGRIYVTLWPKEGRAVLKLSPDEQAAMAQNHPEVFTVGSWGRQGWTSVDLARVQPTLFRELLEGAWRRAAPAKVRAAPASRAGSRRRAARKPSKK